MLGLFIIFINSSLVFANETTFFPQQISANKLLHYCASSSLTSSGRNRQKFCNGFISGVEETERLLRGELSSAPAVVCLPKGKNSVFYADIFINYANRKGVNLKRPAVVVVIEALENKFRCK